MVYVCTSLILLAAAAYDYCTLEVPLYISIPALMASIVWAGIQGFPLEYVFCGLFLFLLGVVGMTLPSLFKESPMGGADALIMSAMGFASGVIGAYAVLYAFLLSFPYTLYMKLKNKEKEYPFVPYLYVGYCISLFLQIVRLSKW